MEKIVSLTQPATQDQEETGRPRDPGSFCKSVIVPVPSTGISLEVKRRGSFFFRRLSGP